MIANTRGIVLKCTKYSESSLIVQMFTEEFGLQSYMIKGARKAKAKIPSYLFSNLALLEIIVNHKEHGNIQQLKECKASPTFQTIPFDIIKGSILLFLNEVLYKSLKHQESDLNLFEFLYNSISYLDDVEKGKENFHLIFLYKLSKYLGFYSEDFDKDLYTHSFKHGPELGIVEVIQNIELMDFENLDELKLNAKQRKFLLNTILFQYKNHIENFNDLNSISILEEVLNA